jgi:hypothetical protein
LFLSKTRGGREKERRRKGRGGVVCCVLQAMLLFFSPSLALYPECFYYHPMPKNLPCLSTLYPSTPCPVVNCADKRLMAFDDDDDDEERQSFGTGRLAFACDVLMGKLMEVPYRPLNSNSEQRLSSCNSHLVLLNHHHRLSLLHHALFSPER